MKSIRYWLCDLLCPDRIFNEDMRLEIDRLTIENESLKSRINELEKNNVDIN